MKITLTAKIKIVPSLQDETLLLTTMEAYKDACNFIASYILSTKELKQFQVNKALYSTLRHQYNLRSQMAQSAIKTTIAGFKTILTNEKKWFKPRFRKPQYDLVWNRDYSLRGNVFSVNTLNGRIKVPFTSVGMEQYFDGTWTFGTAKLVYKHKKWFLHIPVTKEVPEYVTDNNAGVVGADLGINFLATAYDSSGKTTFFSGRSIKQKRGKFSNRRKSLQMRKTSSSRRRLKAMGKREHRWMQDVNHQVSKALVNLYPENTLFVLEDLTGIRSATEKVHISNRYISVSWSFYDLRKKLEYKAHLKGSKVLLVNPEYTSQACPLCGHTEKNNRNKKQHSFCCLSCGYASNDDRIGAMNLHSMGIKYLNAVACG